MSWRTSLLIPRICTRNSHHWFVDFKSIDLDFDHERMPWTWTILISLHNFGWTIITLTLDFFLRWLNLKVEHTMVISIFLHSSLEIGHEQTLLFGECSVITLSNLSKIPEAWMRRRTTCKQLDEHVNFCLIMVVHYHCSYIFQHLSILQCFAYPLDMLVILT